MARKKKSWWRKLWRRKRPALATRPEPTAAPASPTIEGFVERLEPGMFRGWAIYRGEGPRPSIVLSINGADHPVSVLPMEREDVANSHAIEHLHAGFRCPLPDALALHLRDALREGQSVQVRCGEVVLPILSMARIAGQALRPEALPSQAPSNTTAATLDAWGHFLVRGYVAEAELSLCCNGVAVECAIVKRPTRGGAPGTHVFELELPGYLWEKTSAPDARIEVLADGEPVLAEPLLLPRSLAAVWVTDIARMPDDTDRQYHGLLALEHTHFGGLWELLDPEARAFLLELAQTMNLTDYLHGQVGCEPLAEEFPGGASTPLAWTAMRELNRRLLEHPDSVFAHVEAITREQQLEGLARRRFLGTTVPLLCRSGELGKLRKLIDVAPLYSEQADESPEHASAAVALLAEEGLFGRAAEMMQRLGAAAGGGANIHTVCITHALERAQSLELAGELDSADGEALREAYIALLASFKGDWFSRLFDAELIRGMVGILAAASHHSDRQQQRAVDTAIRLYGLCPAFWEAASGKGLLVRPELARAHKAFASVHTAVSAQLPGEHRIAAAREALEYFVRHGNPDAAACLRELFARDVVESGGHPSSAACAIAAQLQSTDAAEAIRIAAFPGLAEDALDRMPGVRDRVLAAIRQVSERPGSPLYAAQCAAYTAWEGAKAAIEGPDTAAADQAVQRLAEYAFSLGNLQAAYLGADLLAEVWSLERRRGSDGEVWLQRLGRLIGRAVETLAAPAPGPDESAADPACPVPPLVDVRPPVLPAAICSALERVAGADNEAASAFLRGMQTLLRTHFGNRYDSVFTRMGQPGPAEPDWPQDTLVVVYSCRPYLDSRVRAIRETWLKDLDSRGIPWLVAVGDGQGTLEGDGVLGLRAPDSYEALPRKTLALVEWVYTNTRARYLIKIDDDCYLDVARYFGTLSYRKHHYYGRIIERAVGGIDRLWHQGKSTGELARKAIDKSPEPSVYADGGGAYSLSRTAMEALLHESRGERGLRLAGTSFLEDKLVGDLLGLAQLSPAAEDYEACQRRRTFPGARPVAMWENTFFPSLISPVKVIHLDCEQDQALARHQGSTRTLWPRKLWPGYRRVSLGWEGNQLELLSDPGKALALARGGPRVVAVMRNERQILPHFLAHYRAQGLRAFLIVDNCSDDGTREYLLGESEDVVLFSADGGYKDSRRGLAWQQGLLANLGGEGWSVLVDADEFLVYPDCETRTLPDFLQEIEAGGADAVSGLRVEMYPAGPLSDADFSRSNPFDEAGYFDPHPLVDWVAGEGYYGNSHQQLDALRYRLLDRACPDALLARKITLLRYRPWMHLSPGAFAIANARMAGCTVALAHFRNHAGTEARTHAGSRRRQFGQDTESGLALARLLPLLARGAGVQVELQGYGGSRSFADAGLFGTKAQIGVASAVQEV